MKHLLKSTVTAATLVFCYLLLAALPASASFESVRFVSEIRKDLIAPVDLSLTDSGDLLVLDAKALQVKVYGPNGVMRHQFGGKGVFSKPVAVAAGPGGMIAVADERLKKVLLFDERGKSLGSFGGSGKGPGQFSKLRDVDIDRFGFIYVSDAGNLAVSRFSTQGILLAAANVAPVVPDALSVDRQGVVHMLAAGGGEVFKFRLHDGNSKRVRISFESTLRGVSGLFVDHKGDSYLTRGSKHSIVKFDAKGKLLASFGSRGKGPGAFSVPTRLDGTNTGEVYIVDSKNKRIQVFSLGGNTSEPLAAVTRSAPTVSLENTEPLSEAVSDLLVASESQQLRLFGKSARILKKGLETAVVGAPGKKAGQFRAPAGVAQLSDGRMVVADTGNNRVQILGTGGQVAVVGERGKEPGYFSAPADVAINSEDMIYVADARNARVQIFTDQGIYMHSFGSPGKSKKDQPAPISQFGAPVALAIDSQDRVHVLDAINQRVVTFDGRGKSLSAILNLQLPTDIAVDNSDNLYVADNGCHCIQVYSPQGKLLLRFGSPGLGPGQLGDISAIATSNGRVLVADKSGTSGNFLKAVVATATQQTASQGKAYGAIKTFKLAMSGLKMEQRHTVSHSYYVPEDAAGDSAKRARYRDLALEEAAKKLAALSGQSAAASRNAMRIDKESVLPGGEVQLMVSVPMRRSVAASTARPKAEQEEGDDEVELAY